LELMILRLRSSICKQTEAGLLMAVPHGGDIDLRIPDRTGRTLAGVLVCMVVWTEVGTPAPAAAQQIRLEPIARTTSSQLHDVGIVADAAMDSNGRVYILDPSVPRVVITDAHLRSLGHFGRRGSGPGEFRDPVSLGVVAGGEVAVLDRALGRITLFEIERSGASARPVRTIPLDFGSEWMCALPGGNFLIYGLHGGQRLHVVGADGRVLRSFAPAEPGLSPMALSLLTRGRMACDPRRDEVLVSSRFLPSVETYRISTGVSTWNGRLEPFRATTVSDAGAQVTIASGPSGVSLVSNVVGVGDYFVFQAHYDSRTDGVAADTTTTYVYSRSRGEWLPHGFRTPLMFGLRDGRVLSVIGRDRLDMTIMLNRVVALSAEPDRPRRRRRN
jgi:hypothetical protein